MAEMLDPFTAIRDIFVNLTDFLGGIASGVGPSGDFIAKIFPLILILGLSIYLIKNPKSITNIKNNLVYVFGITIASLLFMQAWGNFLAGHGIFYPMLMTLVIIIAVATVCVTGYLAWGYVFRQYEGAMVFKSGAVLIASLALTIWLLQMIPTVLPENMSIAVMQIRTETFGILGLTP